MTVKKTIDKAGRRGLKFICKNFAYMPLKVR